MSRDTVVEACEPLIEEGHLSAERTVGTFVADRAPDDAFAVGAPQARTPSDPRVANLPLPHTGRGPPGPHAPDHRSLLHDFAPGRGRTDVRSFPERAWRRLILDCLGGAAARTSEYMDPAGLPDLRQLITNLLGPARGMVVPPEQVLIVVGCQQGLNLAAHLSLGTRGWPWRHPAVAGTPSSSKAVVARCRGL